MINCFYNKYSINILAIILSLSIMFGISYIISSSKIKSVKNVDNSIYENSNVLNENRQFNNTINDLSINEDLKSLDEINEENMIEKLNEKNSNKWYLEIEKIELIAEIMEGTEEEILDNFIGHFSNTPVKIGNVCLAAHNRGYKNNYFSRLKELKIGDKINYYINGNKFVYKVEEILIIYETDWSMLENTKDNRITMITCIENREKYRLCVQAVRIKEV